jgi:hypothetical protein
LIYSTEKENIIAEAGKAANGGAKFTKEPHQLSRLSTSFASFIPISEYKGVNRGQLSTLINSQNEFLDRFYEFVQNKITLC